MGKISFIIQNVYIYGLLKVLYVVSWIFITIGTARRGEDGDQNKVRRQPKPVKPKKMIKVDGQYIVFVACNNGTTALVNKEGELIMFGKDTTHADPLTGMICFQIHIQFFIFGIKNVFINDNRRPI